MPLTKEKKALIEQLLKDGYSQNKVMEMTKSGKPTVRKIRLALEEKQKQRVTNGSTGSSSEFLSVEDVDRYIKECMTSGKDPNTALLNTGIKLLELKNKIEPEHLKKSQEKERVKFEETLKDAINYVHTLRPDYKIAIPAKLSDDDKTSGSEG